MIKYTQVLAAVALIVCAAFPVKADDTVTDNATVLLNNARNQAEADKEYAQGKSYYDHGRSSTQDVAKQDYARALMDFHAAADKGKTEALLMLAVMYSEGDGVKQNYTEAVKWYQAAAKKSNAKLQESLSAIYENIYDNNKVTLPDYLEPYLRYNLAAGQ